MAISQRPPPLDAFLTWPETKPARELFEGAVRLKEPAGGPRSLLQGFLAWRLDDAGRSSGLAKTFIELRTSFGGASLVPDVAVYRRERIPRDAAGEVAEDFFESPDIVGEIVPPGDGLNVLVRRCVWYVANGVRIALLVNPKDRSVLIFRPGAVPTPLRGADRIDLDEVVPGFQLTVDELFAALRD